MNSHRHKFVRPGSEPLYPTRGAEDAEDAEPAPRDTDPSLGADGDSTSSFVYNRHHHLPMEAQRQRLPVFQYRSHILWLLERHQTLVLLGATGCGKSTQVPQYLHEIGHTVCVTQPRAAAAVALARRVAAERAEPLGERVGYAAGAAARRGARCGIVFVTEGALLREMFASPLLMQYSCVVLDEVHERSQSGDLLLALLRKVAQKRKKLKLVISSATMDAEFLRQFFDLSRSERDGASGVRRRDRDGDSTAAILSVEGRTHPVDVFYAEEPVADYAAAAVRAVVQIHETQPFGDVLVFLASQEEILSAQESLEAYAEQNNALNAQRTHLPSGVRAAALSVLPMYGSLPPRRQLRVFQTAPPGVRKVVLATNVAETSVTVPGVVYVVDCGFHKLPYYVPAAGVQGVAVLPVARSNAQQRAGRAGRTAPGHCYRLYTEAEYEALPARAPPALCRSDLSAALLLLAALGIRNVLRFRFPTAPPARSLLCAVETLVALQALDREGRLTAAPGALMAELPLAPPCARMLCASARWGCVDAALSAAAMLQVSGAFLRPGGAAAAAARRARREHFEVAEGDVVMYVNVLEAYLRRREPLGERAAKAWCRKMFLNHGVMEKASEIRVGLEKLVRGRVGMEEQAFEGPDLGSAKTERLLQCVAAGYFPQAARLHADGAYRAARAPAGAEGGALHISPDSCLFHQQQPQWLVYAGVSSARGRTYLRELTPVRAEWLLQAAPHYYTLS